MRGGGTRAVTIGLIWLVTRGWAEAWRGARCGGSRAPLKTEQPARSGRRRGGLGQGGGQGKEMGGGGAPKTV